MPTKTRLQPIISEGERVEGATPIDIYTKECLSGMFAHCENGTMGFTVHRTVKHDCPFFLITQKYQWYDVDVVWDHWNHKHILTAQPVSVDDILSFVDDIHANLEGGWEYDFVYKGEDLPDGGFLKIPTGRVLFYSQPLLQGTLHELPQNTVTIYRLLSQSQQSAFAIRVVWYIKKDVWEYLRMEIADVDRVFDVWNKLDNVQYFDEIHPLKGRHASSIGYWNK